MFCYPLYLLKLKKKLEMFIVKVLSNIILNITLKCNEKIIDFIEKKKTQINY